MRYVREISVRDCARESEYCFERENEKFSKKLNEWSQRKEKVLMKNHN